MKYTKLPLSFEQQAQRLLDRGLIADKKTLVEKLTVVNYYRLSAYWYNFKQFDEITQAERFAPGTSFEKIWRRYSFDRELRHLIKDALEDVEVAILRTRLVEYFTRKYGAFGYVEPANFRPEFSALDYSRSANPRSEHSWLLHKLNEEIDRSKEHFVGLFREKYPEEPYFPLWIAAETMAFGELFTMFRYLHYADLRYLSSLFNLYPEVMVSWLRTLLFARNACAHHARLWNRVIPVRPYIPRIKHNPEWHSPVQFDATSIFTVLALLNYLLKYIRPQNDFRARLENLLEKYPDIPRDAMGFPSNWKDSPIWK